MTPGVMFYVLLFIYRPSDRFKRRLIWSIICVGGVGRVFAFMST